MLKCQNVLFIKYCLLFISMINNFKFYSLKNPKYHIFCVFLHFLNDFFAW